MSKIYLEVSTPGNAKSYEFSADSRMTAGRVKAQFIRQIEAVENFTLFENKEQVIFACLELEGLMQDGDILGEVGVTSGSRIILL